MSTHTIRFLPYETTIQVQDGDTVIRAALAAGVHVNASCGGEGVCGKCRVLIEDGAVEGGISEKLSAEDQEKGYRLACQAKVKSDLDGSAFLEMWAHVGGGEYFSRGANDIVSQKTDWKLIQTPFFFQKEQRPDKVTLNLVINGKGTVWIDDIVLIQESLK